MQRDRPMPTFKEMERDGWHEKAAYYDSRAGRMTREAVGRLLKRVHAAPGKRFLDICCGPGYVAGEAASRGLAAVGVDIAPAMLDEARRRFPDVEFREGDAEALAFPDASFDAVVCAFGLLHLAEPDKALSEAFRVLRLGGRYAFTVWSSPEKGEFLRLALNAVTTHANMNVPLPAAPPIFQYSDPAASQAALERAGFCDVDAEELPIRFQGRSPEDVFDWLDKSAVRTMALFRLQTAEVQQRIKAAVLDGAQAYATADGIEIPSPAMLYAARKP
jgi:ubiquinone/menaquinone biosynthesis C-methylase UbiE